MEHMGILVPLLSKCNFAVENMTTHTQLLFMVFSRYPELFYALLYQHTGEKVPLEKLRQLDEERDNMAFFVSVHDVFKDVNADDERFQEVFALIPEFMSWVGTEPVWYILSVYFAVCSLKDTVAMERIQALKAVDKLLRPQPKKFGTEDARRAFQLQKAFPKVNPKVLQHLIKILF